MHDHQTDCLVIGAGCVGLACTDTLIREDPHARAAMGNLPPLVAA